MASTYTADQASDGMVAGRKPTCDETEQCDGMVAGRIPAHDETEQCDGMVAGRKPAHDETEQCDGMVAGRKPTCDETEQCDGMVTGRKPTCDKTEQSWYSLHVALNPNFLLVAAIDIGTTYSGVACSIKNDYQTDPQKICIHPWSGNTSMSHKAPTCVLFDPQKRFSKFGYEAEDKYMSLASEDDDNQDHRKWFFFRRFKMTLFDKMNLRRQYILKDETGKEMPALDVFSAAIRYLKNHFIEKFRKSVTSVIENSDIRWVLTVPAIWTDACKQFMREAANMAGIQNDNLLIALEPEAASICCRYLPLHSIDNDRKRSMFESFVPGSKYMVFDAGGGTVDITVHEVEKSGKLKELYAANGGNWGGIYVVDQAFKQFLACIVGDDIMENFQTNSTGDYIDLFREFEIKTRKFRSTDQETIQFHVPKILSTLFMKERKQNIKDFVGDKFKMQGNLSWRADKLKIDAATIKGFFTVACQSILQHLEALFRSGKIDDVPTILMVGGFSEHSMLQEIIKERFKDKRIIIPPDPDMAVLKGAVIFGHDPTVIEQRCCRKTYGVEAYMSFREGIDPEKDKVTDDLGRVLCRKRFDKHVEIGQAIKFGESLKPISYRPLKADQNAIKISFVASSQPSPEYTYDYSCQSIGSLSIDLKGSGMDKSVEVELIFGWTELEAVATDKNSGCQVKTTLNF